MKSLVLVRPSAVSEATLPAEQEIIITCCLSAFIFYPFKTPSPLMNESIRIPTSEAKNPPSLPPPPSPHSLPISTSEHESFPPHRGHVRPREEEGEKGVEEEAFETEERERSRCEQLLRDLNLGDVPEGEQAQQHALRRWRFKAVSEFYLCSGTSLRCPIQDRPAHPPSPRAAHAFALLVKIGVRTGLLACPCRTCCRSLPNGGLYPDPCAVCSGPATDGFSCFGACGEFEILE